MSYLRNATIMMKNPPKSCNSKQQNKYLPQKLYLLITMLLVFQTVALVPTLQDFKILVFLQPKCWL